MFDLEHSLTNLFCTVQPKLLAISNTISFANPKAPLYPRLAQGKLWNEVCDKSLCSWLDSGPLWLTFIPQFGKFSIAYLSVWWIMFIYELIWNSFCFFKSWQGTIIESYTFVPRASYLDPFCFFKSWQETIIESYTLVPRASYLGSTD